MIKDFIYEKYYRVKQNIVSTYPLSRYVRYILWLFWYNSYDFIIVFEYMEK